MARRGPGAVKITEHEIEEALKFRLRQRWMQKGLSMAERLIMFCEDMPITEGPHSGKKVKLAPFQVDFINNTFRQDKDGVRPVSRASLCVGRKCGKTQLSSILALACLVGPLLEPRTQVISAAVTKAQAALVFENICAIIRRHNWMICLCNIKTFNKRIELLDGGFYQAISADSRNAQGLSPVLAIADECAQWPSRALWDALTTAGAGRAASLVVGISTQAEDSSHFWADIVQHGVDIKNGVVEDSSFYGQLHTIPPELDCYDPANWNLSLPALGYFRSDKDLYDLSKQAKKSVQMDLSFQNLLANRMVQTREGWLSAQVWIPAIVDARIEDFYGEEVALGVDLSLSGDLSAIGSFFPSSGMLFCHAFLPAEDILGRGLRDSAPYKAWAVAGYLDLTPGRTIDYQFIANKIKYLHENFRIKTLRYDSWSWRFLQAELEGIGLGSLPTEEFRQGYKTFGEAVPYFEKLLLDGKLHPVRNPCLTSAISAVSLSRDAMGNVKPEKGGGSARRIDPAVASIMAVWGNAVASPEKPKFDPGSIRVYG